MRNAAAPSVGVSSVVHTTITSNINNNHNVNSITRSNCGNRNSLVLMYKV